MSSHSFKKKNLFVPRLQVLRPGFYNLCTIFDKMPRFEPELLPRCATNKLHTYHSTAEMQYRGSITQAIHYIFYLVFQKSINHPYLVFRKSGTAQCSPRRLYVLWRILTCFTNQPTNQSTLPSFPQISQGTVLSWKAVLWRVLTCFTKACLVDSTRPQSSQDLGKFVWQFNLGKLCIIKHEESGFFVSDLNIIKLVRGSKGRYRLQF